MELESSTRSIRRARHWVRENPVCAGLEPDAVRVAELLTSELVTNAVKYGPRGGTIRVRAERDRSTLGVTVTDDGPERPVVRHPAPDELGGRGMGIVQSLACDWGVDVHEGNGKSVWFRVPVRAH
ncbi:MAG TPA: ATP-binding protein [Actinotalea sp.]